MKSASLAALVVLATLAPPARAEGENVRVCIAASTNGQALRQQGKLLAAREEMIACARDACPPIVRSHCARWLAEVDAAIPSIVVRAEDAGGTDILGARLSIDGRPAKLDGQPVRLDPGQHAVTIEVDRGARKEERVLVVEGQASRLVTVRLPGTARATAPAREAPTATQRHVPAGAWVLGAAGIVSLGAASYFGVTAQNDLHTLQTTCSPHCTDSATQSGRTDAGLFYATLGAGGAAVAGALVWALAFPRTEASAGAQVGFVPLGGGAMTTLVLKY
jgi:hypothetical protein